MAVSPGSQSQGTGLDCFTSWYLFPSVVDKPAMSEDYNPLILRSTGHAGDIGDDQLQSRVPRRSTCLELPKNLVLRRLSRLSLLRDLPVQGSPGGQHVSTCPGTQFWEGQPALTCPVIQSPGGCHTSACLGVCTLTQGCLALRLQQYWIG